METQARVKTTEDLRALEDSVLTLVRCLETLAISGDQSGVFRTPKVLSKLPNDIPLEWARGSAGRESDLLIC